MRKKTRSSRRAPAKAATAPPSPPPSPSIRWIPLVLSIACGAYGSWALAGSSPAAPDHWKSGALVHLVSLVLLWLSFPPQGVPAPVPLPVKPSTVNKFSSSPVVAGVTAVLAALSGEVLFLHRWTWLGLLAWAIAAVALFGLIRMRRSTNGPAPANPSRIDAWAALSLVLVACALTLPFLRENATGLQIDEANNLEGQVSILRGTFRSPFSTLWGGNPSLCYFLNTFFFWIFGPTLEAARLAHAFLSVLGVYFFYRLCRFHVGPFAAWAATFLMAVGWWWRFYSLSPFMNMPTGFFEILALYALERGFREGNRFFWIVSGVAASAALQAYISGRLVPFIVAGTVVGLAAVGGRSFLRAHGRNLCLGALAFLWLTGPFIVFAHRVPTEIFARAQELNIFAAMHSQNDPGLLWRKTASTLLSPFFPSVSTDTRFGLPDTAQMDPFAAVFAGFGILTALVRPRSRFTWFILPGLAVGFAANIFAHWVILPHHINSLRFFLVVPFLYLAAARGFQVLAPLASRTGPIRYLTVATLAAGLFGAALFNANVYHFGFRNSPRCWDVMGFPSFETDRYVHLYAPHRRIMMDWEVLSSHARFHLLDLPEKPDNWEDAKPFPLDQPGEKGIAAFVLARKWPQRLKEVRETAPHARTIEVKDPWGGLVMGIIDVPPKKKRP